MIISGFSPRLANFEDIDKLALIDKRVHVAPWTASNFEEELKKPYSHTLVLTDDETDEVLAAYATYWLMFDECQLLNIAVDLSFRGLGFARYLLQKIKSFCVTQGLKRITLDVRKSNLAAIQLYQNQKFEVTHLRKNLYSNREDGYQMILSLDEDANNKNTKQIN